MVCHCFVHCILCLTTSGFRLPCWGDGRVRLMVFDTTFSNISIIFWPSLLLVEEIAVTGNPTEQPQVTDKTVSHSVVSSRSRNGPDSIVNGFVVMHSIQIVKIIRNENSI
jgi:hypothetical protein